MDETVNSNCWWELHLRKARGAALSAEEARWYEAELDRQERDAAPLHGDIGTLKKMRAELADLGQVNAELRSRLNELDREIRLS